MKPGVAAATVVLLGLAACRTARPPVEPAGAEATARAMAFVRAAREEAWRPRRFQALFRGEASPKIGIALRGYLSLRWDGEALAWRASAPLAGAGRSGLLRRSGGDAHGIFPGRLGARDVLAVLLGVPEELPSAEGASLDAGRVALRLPSGEGREVLVSASGEVSGLVLPDGVRVELTAGSGVPRRIVVRGPEGNAVLTLESFGDWPAGEEEPQG